MLATFVPSGGLWLLSFSLNSPSRRTQTGHFRPQHAADSSAEAVTSHQPETNVASIGGSRLGLSTDVRDACRVLYPYLLLMAVRYRGTSRAGHKQADSTTVACSVAVLAATCTKGFSLWVAYSAGQLTDACPLLQTVGSLQPNSVLSSSLLC